MIGKKPIFISVLLAAFVCLAKVASAQQISTEERKQLERQALQGSGAAAQKIALFYGTGDDKLFEYWSWIGAENGDPLCQHNYASILWGRKDPYSKLRAIYWMKKAAANHADWAEESLREMLSEEEKWEEHKKRKKQEK